MGRIGTLGCSKVYSYAEEKFEKPYGDEKPNEMAGYLAVGGTKPYYDKITDAPFKEAFKYIDEENIEEKINRDRQRLRFNKTDYEIKVGKRSEGTIFSTQDGKPYVELGSAGYGAGGIVSGNAPSTDLLSPKEKKFITTSIPVQPVKETYYEKGQVEYNKLQSPTDRDKIIGANENPNQFISMNLGDIEVYPSTAAGFDYDGSNVKRDMMKDAQQPEPLTQRQLFEMNYLSPQSTSGMMMTKQQVLKSKAILNWYGGAYQTPQPTYQLPAQPATKMDFEVMDALKSIKAKKKAKKSKKEEEKKEMKYGKLKVPSPFE